jgi:hypothetical protein
LIVVFFHPKEPEFLPNKTRGSGIQKISEQLIASWDTRCVPMTSDRVLPSEMVLGTRQAPSKWAEMSVGSLITSKGTTAY